MEDVKRNLEDEVQSLIEMLDYLDSTTEEYKQVSERLNTLYKLKLEEEKINQDRKDKKIDRFFKYVFEGIGIGAPLMFYGIWMKRGFKFEETGVFKSKTFTDLIKFFKPKK